MAGRKYPASTGTDMPEQTRTGKGHSESMDASISAALGLSVQALARITFCTSLDFFIRRRILNTLPHIHITIRTASKLSRKSGCKTNLKCFTIHEYRKLSANMYWCFGNSTGSRILTIQQTVKNPITDVPYLDISIVLVLRKKIINAIRQQLIIDQNKE